VGALRRTTGSAIWIRRSQRVPSRELVGFEGSLDSFFRFVPPRLRGDIVQLMDLVLCERSHRHTHISKD